MNVSLHFSQAKDKILQLYLRFKIVKIKTYAKKYLF